MNWIGMVVTRFRWVFFVLVVACMLLTGCSSERVPEAIRTDPVVINQCVRADLFKQCMASLPAGPVSTQYNDWDEVVDSCASQMTYLSYRLKSQVPIECRAE